MHKILAAAAIVLSSTSFALAAPAMMSETDIGSVLTDEEGMTLYIFDRDEPGVSNCYDQCAENWPPFFAEEGAEPEGDFTLVERNDGTMMWAHDGWPLYYWINDVAPGDTTGDGVGDVWHVVKADM